MTTQTKEVKTVELARCRFCGRSGIYGQEIVDTDYHDPITGRDTVKFSCKDIKACLERGGGTKAIF